LLSQLHAFFPIVIIFSDEAALHLLKAVAPHPPPEKDLFRRHPLCGRPGDKDNERPVISYLMYPSSTPSPSSRTTWGEPRRQVSSSVRYEGEPFFEGVIPAPGAEHSKWHWGNGELAGADTSGNGPYVNGSSIPWSRGRGRCPHSAGLRWICSIPSFSNPSPASSNRMSSEADHGEGLHLYQQASRGPLLQVVLFRIKGNE